jgi:anti-sigma-K factor RskA
MAMSAHSEWEELAAGYALHGLSGEDEARFVSHLETCAECAASMKDYDFVAAQLGSIAHYPEAATEPPAWESLRAAVVGEPQERAGVTHLATRRRRDLLARRSLAAAAGVVVLAGGGVATWQLTTGSGSSCSASDGCHQVELAAAGGKTAASLVIRNEQVSMTPTSAMAPAPAGKAYVLWQQPRDGHVVAIGEFAVASGRPVTATLQAPYADTQEFAVSLENSGPPPTAPSNQLASGLAS